MMKKLFFLFTFFFFNSVHAQSVWQYGLELNVNGSIRNTYQRNTLYSLNAFGIYKQHELYSGFDIIGMSWYVRRTWGFEAGYKFHLHLKSKRSNIMTDLNYQFSRYASGCIGPVGYNFIPKSIYGACEASSRVKSHLLSCGMGYELFYTKWLSSSLTAGPGINWAKTGDPRPEVLEMEHRSPSGAINHHTLFFLLIKASIRITL